MSENNNNGTMMKWVVLAISGSMFMVSVIAQLFNPSHDTREVTYVFIVVAGLIFGANFASLFLKK